MSTSRHTFTLTELLVAIAIVLILVGMTIAGVGYARRRADEAKTVAILEQFAQGLEAFRAEKGFYPPCEGEVKLQLNKYNKLFLIINSKKYTFYSGGKGLLGSEDNMNGDDFKKGGNNFCEFGHLGPLNPTTETTDPMILKDAWGDENDETPKNAIKYKCPGIKNVTGYDLQSNGPNGVADDDDDITNWGDNKH